MKKLFCFLAPVLLMFMAGCLDYDENMTLNKDGSGTVRLQFAVDHDYLKQLLEVSSLMTEQSEKGGESSDMDDLLFSRSKIEENLKLSDAGIKLISYKTSETAKSHVWDMDFSFADVNKIDALADALSAGAEAYNPSTDTDPVYAARDDGSWLFSQSFMETEDEDEADESESDEPEIDDTGTTAERWSLEMKTMMAGTSNHTIRIAIEFPGKIIETNATSFKGSSATWEYNMGKLQDAPEELRAVIKP